jgi:hypothetical protein
MKCPKCDYLGFETGDRCKNCGYDFSLTAAPQEPPVDLALKAPAHEDLPIGDLWFDSSQSGPQSGSTATAPALPVESFPLFSPSGDDEPLIKTPSEPRPPLAVRRTPDLSRGRNVSRPPRTIESGLTLEFAEETPLERALKTPLQSSSARIGAVSAWGAGSSSTTDIVAGLGSRTIAALIDHAILFGIDVVVLYSTLRMTALTTDEWRSLPLLPFLAFLVFLKLGYFAAFTAILPIV